MIFLVGHRGVGKTTIIKDLKQKYQKANCLDLDEVIESDLALSSKTQPGQPKAGLKIIDLFTQGQTKLFRQLELTTLTKIIKNFENSLNQKVKSNMDEDQTHRIGSGFDATHLIVALGAGFQLQSFNFPKDSLILWIRKSSDTDGRIFSDRPRLTNNLDPILEWQEIFKAREEAYQTYANAQIFIPEYFDSTFNPLKEYLNFRPPENGFVTLIPKENDQLLLSSNCPLELRSDLLSEAKIIKILQQKKSTPHIVALRKKVPKFYSHLLHIKLKLSKTKNPKNNVLIDWDMALGFPAKKWLKLIDIFSTHSSYPISDVLVFLDELSRNEVISNSLVEKFKTQNSFKNANLKRFHFKISPEVQSHQQALDFDLELQEIFQDLEYSYLPRSSGSLNLTYFRQLKSHQQKIGFYRFGQGSSKDQPFWWQWPQKDSKGYYGIWGENIKHSLTPGFHFKFMQNKKLWPLSIDGFDSLLENKNYLAKNGLKILAVTSPYKNIAYLKSKFMGSMSVIDSLENSQTENSRNHKTKFKLHADSDVKAANTLIFKKASTQKAKLDILGFNTDTHGLQVFLNRYLNRESHVIIWGGGALLSQLQNVIRKMPLTAAYIAAQRGEPRTEADKASLSQMENQSVCLIWASGQKGKDLDQVLKQISIHRIIDLDYRENSKAKLYSFMKSIDYVSGFEFFKEQALAQQQIWDTYEF